MYSCMYMLDLCVRVCSCMSVTFAVNAMRIFGNNRKVIGNNWTISQELWNRIIGKFLSIIASGLVCCCLSVSSAHWKWQIGF